ncbi:hypothetical protein ACVIGB_001009 [Bradyrhizobium sp. USDA 4341]
MTVHRSITQVAVTISQNAQALKMNCGYFVLGRLSRYRMSARQFTHLSGTGHRRVG